MTHRAVFEERGTAATQWCRHHWLIETPNGVTSWGTCRQCGEQRQFMNSASDAFWEGEYIPGSEGVPLALYKVHEGFSREADEDF
jgi:hypothetical protein